MKTDDNGKTGIEVGKEPPRTCGACQHQGYCRTYCDSSLAEVCARFRPEGGSYLNDPDPLEQRCQQLEQVARDMFNHMQGLDDILRKNAHDEYMRTVGKAVIGDIADRLEALGVSLDGQA